MSGYYWDAKNLEWLGTLAQTLDSVPEPPDHMHLRIELIAHGEPIGFFSDELGSWAYVDEPLGRK